MSCKFEICKVSVISTLLEYTVYNPVVKLAMGAFLDSSHQPEGSGASLVSTMTVRLFPCRVPSLEMRPAIYFVTFPVPSLLYLILYSPRLCLKVVRQAIQRALLPFAPGNGL